MTKLGKYKYSPYIWGFIGSTGITVVFYLVQSLGMQSFSAPFQFFSDKWYFITPLIVGFGIQMGLFRAIRLMHKISMGPLAVSGSVSTIGMFVCCLHNIVPLLPILGLSGLAVFFGVYQDYIFIFSILTVLGGILYMIYQYKKTVKNFHQ
jgi:hypothetical protein